MIHTLHRAQERHTDRLRGCYRHRTPQGARQTASAATEGMCCGSTMIHTLHRAQKRLQRASAGYGGHALRLYIMRARTHTLHRAQERHTDRLRGCYRHRTPSGARQTASAGQMEKSGKSAFYYCFSCICQKKVVPLRPENESKENNAQRKYINSNKKRVLLLLLLLICYFPYFSDYLTRYISAY